MARILAFTGAGGDNFYYTTGLDGAPQMQITDNSASSFVVDFSDTALLAGISADPLFQLVELGECAGVIGYAERLFWWGERNKQNNWDNLTFDGGFGGSGFNVPLGWTPDAHILHRRQRGHHRASDLGRRVFDPGRRRDADARTDHAIRRHRLQRRAAPASRTPAYSARVRVRMTGALTQGTLHVHFTARMLGISTTGVAVPAAQVTANAWTGIYRADHAIRGVSDDSLRPGAARVCRRHADQWRGFLVENIEIFPTAEPYNTSLVRASFAEDPESYDGVSGFMSVSEDDGQTVRAAFLLRENLYFVKDRSIYVTADDGVNEPASWTDQRSFASRWARHRCRAWTPAKTGP